MQMAASADVDMVRSCLRSVSRLTVHGVIAVVCFFNVARQEKSCLVRVTRLRLGSPCHSLFLVRLVRVRLVTPLLSSEGVGVLRSVLPTSLFEHQSMV